LALINNCFVIIEKTNYDPCWCFYISRVHWLQNTSNPLLLVTAMYTFAFEIVYLFIILILLLFKKFTALYDCNETVLA